MDCLVLPISLLRKCGTASQLGYRRLPEDRSDELDQKVTVVVGKEKNEFLIDPFMLEESPFRVLIDVVKEEYGSEVIMDAKGEKKRVNLVELDVILFEHMLWLMNNDCCCSLLQLNNFRDIIDFYVEDALRYIVFNH